MRTSGAPRTGSNCSDVCDTLRAIGGGGGSCSLDYSVGVDVDVSDLLTAAQILSNLEGAYRSGYFNPLWEPRPEINAELEAMLHAFDPAKLFKVEKVIFLNPTFEMSCMVGGGDADLIYDRTIVDIKTSKHLELTIDHLRQLAGYAALHTLGGVLASEEFPCRDPIEEIGIYYARFGRFVRWRLDDLFPDNGFAKFVKCFEAEMAKSGRRRIVII
jgi:hypothetical protein